MSIQAPRKCSSPGNLLPCALMAASLVACGGGTEPARLQLSNQALVQVVEYSDLAPTLRVQAEISDAPVEGVFIYAEPVADARAISQVEVTLKGNNRATLVIGLKSPADVGLGTFSESISVRACYDAACTRQVANSPLVAELTYQVLAGVPRIESLRVFATSWADPKGYRVTLEVGGRNIVPGAVVQWNGRALRPAYTTLIEGRQVVRLDVETGISYESPVAITVSTLAQGGSISLPYASGAMEPLMLQSLSLVDAHTLKLTGTGFTPTTMVLRGVPVWTEYVSPTELLMRVQTPLSGTNPSIRGIRAFDFGGAGGQSNEVWLCVEPTPPLTCPGT